MNEIYWTQRDSEAVVYLLVHQNNTFNLTVAGKKNTYALFKFCQTIVFETN